MIEEKDWPGTRWAGAVPRYDLGAGDDSPSEKNAEKQSAEPGKAHTLQILESKL